jgi:serine/threonine protein phosphatase Stp1
MTTFETNLCTAGRFRSWSASHMGAVRTRNEDNCVNRPDLGLWAVADGAGGHQSGDIASATVVAALSRVPGGVGAAQALAEVRLRLGHVHELLTAEAARRGGDALLASTVVTLLAREDHFACLWVGDSRAYLLRDGRLVQVSHDHSLVQRMLDRGEIDAAAAAAHPWSNVVTRAVGAGDGSFTLDKVTGRLHPGDRFLLCSDGLSKTLPDAELSRLMADANDPVERLLAAALEHQVDDNVTAVVVHIQHSEDARSSQIGAGSPPWD